MGAFRKCLEIRERLSRGDPSNAQRQRDLMMSLYKLAEASEPADAITAVGWWRMAHDQLADMNRRGVMIPSNQETLEFVRRKTIVSTPPTAACAEPRPTASTADAPPAARRPAPPPTAVALLDPNSPAQRAARLSIEYQRAMARWNTLSWWQRLRTLKPEPPSGL